MGLLIRAANLYVPGYFRKQKLELLFSATARAFGVPMPSIKELDFNRSLELYARFSRDEAEKVIRQGRQGEVRARLFQNAWRIGQQFKTDFKVSNGDVLPMAALIYKILKINFRGCPGGDIEIKKCFFKDYYSGQVCGLISALDEGLLVGLAGRGRLSFNQRLTEGADSCRARLETGGLI